MEGVSPRPALTPGTSLVETDAHHPARMELPAVPDDKRVSFRTVRSGGAWGWHPGTRVQLLPLFLMLFGFSFFKRSHEKILGTHISRSLV